MMARRLERLAYRSRAHVTMDSLVLIADILGVSQRNNRRDGLTGALAYSDGTFFQVIEGAPTDLDHLLERLAADPRHGEITVVLRTPVSGRLFPDWAMTAPRINPETAAGLRRVVEDSDTTPALAVEALRLLTIAPSATD